MDLPSDLDLVNAPEFLEFLNEQNLSEESLEYIGQETKRLFDIYVENTNKIVKLCMENTSRIQEEVSNQENVAPTGASSKPSNSKRSIRNSNVKSGKAPTATNRKISKSKSYIAKQDVNNDLSQALEEKATVSSIPQEGKTGILNDTPAINDMALGKVRIEIKTDFLSKTKSPHEGEIRLLEAKTNAPQVWKIGRSTGKEFSELGVSLHLDLEVSTKHGMLTRTTTNQNEVEYYYTDVGSTNGTYFVTTGDCLNANEKYKLMNGTELRMGQSILKFNFSS